jgi:hypothetical protein
VIFIASAFGRFVATADFAADRAGIDLDGVFTLSSRPITAP